MKTRNLLITLGVAAMATVNALAVDGVLSPRLADNQPKAMRGYNSDPNLAATGLSSVTPRVQDNQVKTVSGKSDKATPSLTCARHMSGSPKMIGACADHPGDTMSCCSGGK